MEFVIGSLPPRKGEFLHGIANVYQTIAGIDHWWIGLSDLGKFLIEDFGF